MQIMNKNVLQNSQEENTSSLQENIGILHAGFYRVQESLENFIKHTHDVREPMIDNWYTIEKKNITESIELLQYILTESQETYIPNIWKLQELVFELESIEDNFPFQEEKMYHKYDEMALIATQIKIGFTTSINQKIFEIIEKNLPETKTKASVT